MKYRTDVRWLGVGAGEPESTKSRGVPTRARDCREHSFKDLPSAPHPRTPSKTAQLQCPEHSVDQATVSRGSGASRQQGIMDLRLMTSTMMLLCVCTLKP